MNGLFSFAVATDMHLGIQVLFMCLMKSRKHPHFTSMMPSDWPKKSTDRHSLI